MTELVQRIARIESTFLGTEDHGIFTASVQLDYGGAGQGAGMLDLRAHNAAFRFVAGVCRVVGVDSWEKVAGHQVFALIDEGGMVRGLEALPFEADAAFLFADTYEERS